VDRSDAPWELRGEAGGAVLRQIVATARGFWHSLHTQALRAGSSRQAVFKWEALPNGDQRLRFAGSDSVEAQMEIEPAMYVDAATSEAGPLELAYPSSLLRHYWSQSPVPPDEVVGCNSRIELDDGSMTFPRLRTIAIQREALSRLAAKLVLSAGPQGSLYFVYNGLPVDSARLHEDDGVVRQMSADSLHEVDRERETERRLRARIEQLLPGAEHSREAWLTFLLDAVPPLRVEGWTVEADETFPYRVVTPDSWYGDLNTGGHEGWFNLQLGVIVAGRQVNLLPALARYLQASLQGELSAEPHKQASDKSWCGRIGDDWLTRLEDGRYLQIAHERIERIADTLVELFDRDSLSATQSLQLPRHQVTRMAELTRQLNGAAWHANDASLRALVEDLANFSGIEPLPAPKAFQATLRPYQQEGLGWLQFLRRYAVGGILADDMGLGKTVQALAHLALEKEMGRLTKPSLIVAPVSVLGNWRQELERFTPHLTFVVWHGDKRKALLPALGAADVIVTAYPLLQIDSDLLIGREFYLVILDEAQMIKNPRAKVSQVARTLRAEHRLCLTGTPLENHLGELWSLYDFLQPGLLGDERHFQRHYRTPIEKNGNQKRAQALSARLAPFLLRRTKDAVAQDLPPKTQIIESIVLDDKQRDLYDGIRLAMHERIREVVQQQGLARSQITILDALLKLRQVCCDPRLVSAEATAQEIPSAKLEWLSTALPELVAEGRRILLFSQFTSMLRLIEAAVTELSIPYCLLTGETRDRAAVTAGFQAGAAPLFLISLKAGGTGLNLTAADTVIHYDPWWNPAVEAQATDRAHRIGQDKPVFVYKLIAQATVEERIVELQASKHSLVSRLYTGKSASPARLSAADLEVLLCP
jgi:superfamily II DNA or RNA helicase